MKKLITAILLASITAGAFALPNLLKKEEFGANAIDELSFDLTSEKICVQETNDDTSIEVEIYCNYKKYAPEVSVSGSTLYIESVRNHMSIFRDPTGLSCTVIVYVPQKKDFEEISIKTASGEISIERPLYAKSEINIEAASGEISSEKGLFADNIKVRASSGEIDLYNIDADDLKVSTSSGDIKIQKFTGSSGSVHASSGEIKATDFASEYAEFKTTSGKITVKKLDCDYFDATSASGGISLELKNAPTASSNAICSSGNIDIYIPMRAKFSVEASSNSGTFRDKFNNTRLNPRDTYQMDYNGGGSVIKLRTASGNITLEY